MPAMNIFNKERDDDIARTQDLNLAYVGAYDVMAPRS
jgi:hypothetical protein